MTRFTTWHLRKMNHCVSGTRTILDKYDLSFNQLLTEGISTEDLRATKDPILVEAAEFAEKNSMEGK